MRILIAEDETIIRLDLRELLEKSGFEVVAEASDGEEAVALARSEEPDLALLDVKMPKLDGIDAARRILDERPIPIVMVTAYGEQELVARAVEAGVFGYLVKPFRESDLLPAIETARARHDELAALREEAASLADALAARKAIERAKGLLMEREGLTEQDAFARLRKASQISGRPLKVVAEALIATLDRPRNRDPHERIPIAVDPAFGGQIPERPASRPSTESCRRCLRTRRAALVLAAPACAPGRPDGRGDEHERGRGDGERERDDGLPGEHLDRAVERPVESRAGHDRAAAFLGPELELDRRVPRLGGRGGAARAELAELRLRLRALLEQSGALRRRGRPLELDGQRGDPRAKPLDLAVEAVERLLEVLDLDVLRDDRAERREPRDRVACATRRDAERQRRRAVGARGVLHVDDVAAEVPRDRERTLRRLGERVGVLDRERERGDVALGTAGHGTGRRLLRRGRVGGGEAARRARCRTRRRSARPSSAVDEASLADGCGRVTPIATADTTASPAAAGTSSASRRPRMRSRNDGCLAGGRDAAVSTWSRSASLARGRVARSSSTISVMLIPRSPSPRVASGPGSAVWRRPSG